MAKKSGNRYSGIGGQAVLEGIMMKNKEKYAVAVRKPDGEIAVKTECFNGVLSGNKLKEIPFVRGVFNFIDSLVLGTGALNYSAEFFDGEADQTREDAKEGTGAKGKDLTSALVVLLAVALAVGIFIVLPYFISSFFERYIRSRTALSALEGVVRILIFVLYVWGISAMEDIRRLYMYHGAEHKCINCIEKGRPLTVHNVMRSSRLHKRCGTSFIFFVLLISIVLFFFIRVDNVFLKVGLRILLMPVVAGISYEMIRLAGRSNRSIVNILSAPGLLIQKITTKEPDEQMAEVAIRAVEAVFDWKAYLKETFGYEIDESWLDDGPRSDEDDEEEPVLSDTTVDFDRGSDGEASTDREVVEDAEDAPAGAEEDGPEEGAVSETDPGTPPDEALDEEELEMLEIDGEDGK